MREFDEAIRHARHGRDDDDDPMPGALGVEGAARDVADAFGVADAGAAVLLDEQAHASAETRGPTTLSSLAVGDRLTGNLPAEAIPARRSATTTTCGYVRGKSLITCQRHRTPVGA